MRKWIVLSAFVAAVVSLAAVVGAAEKEKKTAMAKAVTVEGTLIDTKCYSMSAANKGNDHETPSGKLEACATACAKMGIPVGLLTSKGEVLILLAPAPNFKDHMAQKARVTGSRVYAGKAIVPEKAEVQGADGKWTEVSTREMM